MSIPIIDQLRPLGNFPAVDASDVQAGNERLSTVLSNTPSTAYVDSVVENKVDKADGKGLSTNDFTNAYKTKLDGLDAALAAKANTSDVTSGLAYKVDKVTGKGLSTNDYTTAEKNKLAGIEAQANKTVVDSSLSTTSTNPVQNKVINTALASKADASTVSSLSSQVSTNTTNIAAQTARIDSIASLPSGSTSGDAELMDIRVKADGTTAQSAGAAVRDQINGIYSKISVNEMLSAIKAGCRLRIWSDDSGFTHQTVNKTRLSCVTPLYYPFDIYLDVNDITDNIAACDVFTFSAAYAHPSKLLTRERFLAGKNGRTIIKLPANTYCCFSVSQVGNAQFESVAVSDNIKASFTKIIDENLNTKNAAADAYEVGVKIKENVNDIYSSINDKILPDFVQTAENSFSRNTEITANKIQYKFLDASGTRDIGTDYPSWYITEDIPVEPYTFYRVTASAVYRHVLYQLLDSDNNVIYNEAIDTSSEVVIEEKLIYTPNNAAKIRIASVNGSTGAALYSTIGKSTTQKWVGKKWICVGDSLTDHNVRTSIHYYDYVAADTGITVDSTFGVGGTGYKKGEDDNNAFYQRVTSIPSDADVVTIFGSGNDLTLISSLGSPTDTGTSTICGCINTTIDNIISINPAVSLGIVAPTPWVNNQPTIDDSNTMAMYTEALRNICKIRSIPFLDLYHCSNLRPWTVEGRAACYSKDEGNGVHPDETGHKLIAPRFKSFLENLII